MTPHDFAQLVFAAAFDSTRIRRVEAVLRASLLPDDAIPAIVTAEHVLDFELWCRMPDRPKPAWLAEYDDRKARLAEEAKDPVRVCASVEGEGDAWWEEVTKEDGPSPYKGATTAVMAILYAEAHSATIPRAEAKRLLEWAETLASYDAESPPIVVFELGESDVDS